MQFPESPRSSKITLDMGEHELMLVFEADEDCNDFWSWLCGPGWEEFTHWKKRNDGYE